MLKIHLVLFCVLKFDANITVFQSHGKLGCNDGSGHVKVPIGTPGADETYTCKDGDELMGFCTETWFSTVCQKQCGFCST